MEGGGGITVLTLTSLHLRKSYMGFYEDLILILTLAVPILVTVHMKKFHSIFYVPVCLQFFIPEYTEQRPIKFGMESIHYKLSDI
jgi:hypothetical protein